MISLIERVLFEYCTLLMKVALNAPIIPFAKSNLSLLTNMETLLGLNVVMLMLKAIHSLIKFTQLRDVFVYDFIIVMKICEGDVYHMFCDKQFSFEDNVFNNFIAFINIGYESISLCWITNLNTKIDHLAFEFVGQFMWATSLD